VVKNLNSDWLGCSASGVFQLETTGVITEVAYRGSGCDPIFRSCVLSRLAAICHRALRVTRVISTVVML